MRRVWILGLFVAFCSAMVSWPLTFAQSNTLPPVFPASLSGNIITSGSDSMAALTQAVVDQFRAAGFPGNVVVDTIGTRQSIERLCRGELDIVNADRQITPEESANCTAQGREVVGFRVATDAIVIVTSPQNDFLTNVTTAELTQILGSAFNWSDVRPEWPNEPINRYIPASNTSEYTYLSDVLFAGNTATMRTALGAQPLASNGEILGRVQGDPRGVAFFNARNANSNRASLKILSVNGIMPDAASVTNRTYVLSRPLLLYTGQQLMQQQRHIADFINYYLTNVSAIVPATNLYPASPDTLSIARDTWLSIMQPVLQQEQNPPTPTPTVTPFTPVELPNDLQETPVPVTQEPAPVDVIAEETQDILIAVRNDLELMARDRLSNERPEGWTPNLNISDAQLAIFVRLNLEVLAGELLGANNRPAGWFGAIQSTPYAVARDVRHDLELLANAEYGPSSRPVGWSDVDPLFRCSRSTQTLVQMLERGGVFELALDPNTPNYCTLVEVEATRFSEINLLSAPLEAAIFSPSARAQLPGNFTVDTEFAVAFLDRGAALSVGVIPFGDPLRPVARSYAQFSNMMLVEGTDYLVFVDYRDTTMTEEEFETLPNADDITETNPTYCAARWCR